MVAVASAGRLNAVWSIPRPIFFGFSPVPSLPAHTLLPVTLVRAYVLFFVSDDVFVTPCSKQPSFCPVTNKKQQKKTNSSNSISTIAGWATAPCPCTILAEHSPCNAHRICRGKTNRNAQDRWTKRTARDTHTETPTHSSMHFFHLPLTDQSISSCFCCC